MSLIIYSNKRKPPEDTNIITKNDAYFNGAVNLSGSKIESVILGTIDKATYCSSKKFYGRSSDTLPVGKNSLSTGTKTLLNIISRPEFCFDLCECGDNVLELLPLITVGKVYWDIPFIAYTGDANCDIIYNNKHYTDFYEFLSTINEGRYDNDET